MHCCPNCGESVELDWRYCTTCAASLTDVSDDNETLPPPSTRDGFLSPTSVHYCRTLIEDAEDLDTESRAFQRLAGETRAALDDFAILSAVAELDVLQLVVAARQQRHDPASTGLAAELFGVLQLYDRAFGTDWRDECSEIIETTLEELSEQRDDIEWPPPDDSEGA